MGQDDTQAEGAGGSRRSAEAGKGRAKGLLAAATPARRERGPLYPRVLLFGVWLPLTQGILFAARFHDDPAVDNAVMFPGLLFGLLLFYLVGCLTMVPFLLSHRRHPGRAVLVNLVYLPFLGCAVLGSLIGGLLGVPGVLVGGTLPLLVPWVVCRLVPARAATA